MKRNLKRGLLLGLAGLFMSGVYAVAAPHSAEAAEGDIPLTSAYFPEDNWRWYCQEKYDKNGDWKLSQEERDAVTWLNINNTNRFFYCI